MKRAFISIIVVTCIFIIESCNEKQQSFGRSNNNLHSILFDKIDSVEIGYFEDCLTCQKLEINTCSDKEFNSVQQKNKTGFHGKIDAKNKLEITFFDGKKTTIQLKQNNGLNGYTIDQYLRKTNCYVLTHYTVDEHLNYSTALLINKKNLIRYYIVSVHTDSAVNGITESPDGKFIAYYENETEGQSHIRVLKIHSFEKGARFFEEYAYLDTDSFMVDELKWLNSKSLGIKVRQTTNGTTYLKVFLK